MHILPSGCTGCHFIRICQIYGDHLVTLVAAGVHNTLQSDQRLGIHHLLVSCQSCCFLVPAQGHCLWRRIVKGCSTHVVWKFVLGMIKIYVHFSINCQHRDGTCAWSSPLYKTKKGWFIYPIYSIPWFLMSWQLKEPGHRQPWYWLRFPRIFRFPHQKAVFLAPH